MTSSAAEMIGRIAVIATCAYAVWRGGAPERLAAAVVGVDWLATPLLEGRDAYHHLQTAIFALDGTAAAILLAIALRSDRYWPLWLAAFQILELLMHVAMVADHHVSALAYYVGMEIASYLMLAALAAGVWLEGPFSPSRSGR